MTGVQLYLPYVNKTIPDYSMIYGRLFHDSDVNDDGTLDALWCQSANSGTDIGVWYYPNGTQVLLFTGEFGNDSVPSPIYSKRFNGQIALARGEVLTNFEGIYTCVIPDENGINQTLVVGLYRNSRYNRNGK